MFYRITVLSPCVSKFLSSIVLTFKSLSLIHSFRRALLTLSIFSLSSKFTIAYATLFDLKILSSNWFSPERDFYKSILLMIAEGSFYKHKFLIYSLVILTSLGKLVMRRLFYYNLEYGFSLAL